MEFKTAFQEETLALGKRIGRLLSPGDVVLLSGEMGAGKSVLARGIAAGMGVQGPIPSPSFTILNLHEAEHFNFYHFDFYRLSGAAELYEAGLDEYIPAADGATIIEWPERAEEALPPDAIRILIETNGNERRITLEEGNRIEAALKAEYTGKGEEKA